MDSRRQPPSREINTSGRIFGQRGIMSAGGARTVIFWGRLDTSQGQKPIDRCIVDYRDSIILPIMAQSRWRISIGTIHKSWFNKFSQINWLICTTNPFHLFTFFSMEPLIVPLIEWSVIKILWLKELNRFILHRFFDGRQHSPAWKWSVPSLF